MILKIVKKEPKEFTGDDGEQHNYFWYIGKKNDGMAIRFGSSADHSIGQEKDFLLEEKTYKNGGKGFAEIVVEEE